MEKVNRKKLRKEMEKVNKRNIYKRKEQKLFLIRGIK